MNRKFISWAFFTLTCKSLGIDDNALQTIENSLLLDPECGDMVEGTGGARKMRVRLAGRGKRSGGRVIYYDTGEVIHFLYAYSKSVQTNLTSAQKNLLYKITHEIRKE